MDFRLGPTEHIDQPEGLRTLPDLGNKHAARTLRGYLRHQDELPTQLREAYPARLEETLRQRSVQRGGQRPGK